MGGVPGRASSTWRCAGTLCRDGPCVTEARSRAERDDCGARAGRQDEADAAATGWSPQEGGGSALSSPTTRRPSPASRASWCRLADWCLCTFSTGYASASSPLPTPTRAEPLLPELGVLRARPRRCVARVASPRPCCDRQPMLVPTCRGAPGRGLGGAHSPAARARAPLCVCCAAPRAGAARGITLVRAPGPLLPRLLCVRQELANRCALAITTPGLARATPSPDPSRQLCPPSPESPASRWVRYLPRRGGRRRRL